ncbi:MAG: GNAT family N-acetyltransferase, partial [Bdellovibrionota bacterium]
MELTLVRPDRKYEQSYLAGYHELTTDSDRSAWVYLGDSADYTTPQRDFGAYVETLLRREFEVPPNFVCDSVYWALQGGEIVGRISLRHELNEFLRKIGGHIGYIVRPSARGKGVATEMLRQVLLTERARSIGKLLLTVNEGNEASERSILKNGGTLDS